MNKKNFLMASLVVGLLTGLTESSNASLSCACGWDPANRSFQAIRCFPKEGSTQCMTNGGTSCQISTTYKTPQECIDYLTTLPKLEGVKGRESFPEPLASNWVEWK